MAGIDPRLAKLKKEAKKSFYPTLGKNVWVHSSAQVIGRVSLKDYASVWPGVILRADINEIVIGRYSNIQDLSCVHLESNRGCYVGDYCVVGHNVILHGCKVGSGALIGIGAIILNDAVIGEGSMIGAGALVPEGMHAKPESLYMGIPARFVRKLTKKEVKNHIHWAEKYARLAALHAEGKFVKLQI